MLIPEYPAEEIDRIIAEEVMRVEGTNTWSGPVARTRIQTLLMSRLCAAWGEPKAKGAIEAVASAETALLYHCGTKEVIRVYVDSGYDVLMKLLLDCDNALDSALDAHAVWPDPNCAGTVERLREGLLAVRDAWSRMRQNIREMHRQGKRVQLHISVFNQMHTALLLGYAVFVRVQEWNSLDEQIRRAFARLGEHAALFFGGQSPLSRD